MLIDLTAAKAHIRDEEAEDAQVEPYLSAAILSASSFLNRRVYATEEELSVAIAGTPATVAACFAAFDLATAAADALADWRVATDAREHAERVYRQAMNEVREIRDGIVINALIKNGILLLFGHLYSNREDVVIGATTATLPLDSKQLLQPYRTGLGV